MNGEYLIALSTALPALAGLGCFFAPKTLRKALVLLTALTLLGVSFMTYANEGYTYTMPTSWRVGVQLVTVLVLVYFIFTAYENRSFVSVGLGVVQSVALLYILYFTYDLKATPTFVVDGLVKVLGLIIGVVGSAVLVYSTSYIDEHDEAEPSTTGRGKFLARYASEGGFYLWGLLLIGMSYGLVMSNNLYWMYMFYTATTLCVYKLLSQTRSKEAMAGAVRALTYNQIGGVALLAAILLSYYYTNSLTLSSFLSANKETMVLLGYAFMALAAFVKAGMIPFSDWYLGSYLAPTPVSALIDCVTVGNLGVFMIMRLAPTLADTYLTYGIALVGVVSFACNATLALGQRFSKRILLFSTVSNMGLMVFCVGINTPLSYSAAVILLIFHAISKSMLIMGAGVIEQKFHTKNIDLWEDVVQKLPLTSVVMVVGMISMFLPMFGMLLGKWAALEITLSAPIFLAVLLMIIMAIGSSATTLFWAKWLGSFTIMPLIERKTRFEGLKAGYLVALIAVLGVNVYISLDSANFITAVVLPALPSIYKAPWNIDTLHLSSQLGSFLVLPIWAAIGLLIIVGGLLSWMKGGKQGTPYLCGANVEGDPFSFKTTGDSVENFKISGMFFASEVTEKRWETIVLYAGILVNLILFALLVI